MSARHWQDGNFYCNITTFDHTKPYVRELWLNTLLNATKIGAVGGVFADHGWGTNIGKPNADGSATLCNGGGALRSCWNFTAEFSAEFNDAHRWVLNTSQDMLAKLPKKGPTVSNPDPFCHFICVRSLSDIDAHRSTARTPSGAAARAIPATSTPCVRSPPSPS